MGDPVNETAPVPYGPKALAEALKTIETDGLLHPPMASSHPQ
jgi:hypothetical protein